MCLASFCQLCADDGAEIKKKKKKPAGMEAIGSHLGPENTDFTKKTSTAVGQTIIASHADGSYISKDIMLRENKEVLHLVAYIMIDL